MKERARRAILHFFENRMQGVGVVEMVLILVVLLGLVVIFRAQLTLIVRSIFASITNTVGSIL